MALFYTKEARESHINRIEELQKKVATVSGNELNYTEATEIINYLRMLKVVIATENKR